MISFNHWGCALGTNPLLESVRSLKVRQALTRCYLVLKLL